MLKKYFDLKLSSFGFNPEDLELDWSVGFVQGDFVSFTGRITMDYVRKLMLRKHGLDVGPTSDRYPLFPDELNDMLNVISDFGDCDLRFQAVGHLRNSSVYVETSDDIEEIFDRYFQPMIVAYNDTISWDKNRVWQSRWKDFQAWLEDCHSQLCGSLLSDAHDILLAGNSAEEVVWKRATENYIAQVIEKPYDDIDDYVDSLDDEDATQFFRSLKAGNLRYGTLTAVILDRETELVLGESAPYCFITGVSANECHYNHIKQCAFADAKANVRDLLARHTKAA